MAQDSTTDTAQAASQMALDPSIAFPDYATSTLAEPQPAWHTLNAARESAFTGEIKFHTAPAIHAYVDGGRVYYAERDGEAPLGQRLLAAGVITTQQLDRGVVRVGDAEHLGRLFDRDESIDRDAVMVIVEAGTEAIVAELASGTVASVAVSAYRHHQSGVHRWFVAPTDSSLSRPVSDVAQVDRSVIDELPDVTSAVSEVRIEWDEPAPAGAASLASPTPLAADQPSIDDIDIEAELERFDADDADWSTRADHATEDDASESWLGDFQIVWPDGSEESATSAASAVPTVEPTETITLDAGPHAPIASEAAPMGVAPLTASLVPPNNTTDEHDATDADADADDQTVQFAMPTIVLESVPAPDDDVPADVASAVRRALQAIETAAVQPTALPQIDLAPLTLPDLQLPTLDDVVPEPEPQFAMPAARVESAPQPSSPALEPPAPSPFSGFAPPTAETRAEAMYARAAAAATASTAGTESAPMTATPVEMTPEPGQASVVFVDENDDGKSRKGALRRLIGSLRKD